MIGLYVVSLNKVEQPSYFEASLIIWDEASMTKKGSVEALDRSMRDIMDKPNLPFGGKTLCLEVILGEFFPLFEKDQGVKY